MKSWLCKHWIPVSDSFAATYLKCTRDRQYYVRTCPKYFLLTGVRVAETFTESKMFFLMIMINAMWNVNIYTKINNFETVRKGDASELENYIICLNSRSGAVHMLT